MGLFGSLFGEPERKRTSLKIKDYVPYKQNDEGFWCSPEMAHECFRVFVEDLRSSPESCDCYIREFDELINRNKQYLREERKSNDEELRSCVEDTEKQIEDSRKGCPELGDGDGPEGGDDYTQEDIDEIKEGIEEEVKDLESEIKSYKKGHQKVEKWIQKQEEKLRTDCRKQLRVVLSAAKSAWNTHLDSDYYLNLEIDYDPPELPDSYYWG